jgi:hypothetical protein
MGAVLDYYVVSTPSRAAAPPYPTSSTTRSASTYAA